jgi:hypothetical protein
MADWPVPATCREQFEPLKTTHKLSSFRVRDTDDTDVEAHWRKALSGAIVEIQFTLACYYGEFKGTMTDSMSASANVINILQAPGKTKASYGLAPMRFSSGKLAPKEDGEPYR